MVLKNTQPASELGLFLKEVNKLCKEGGSVHLGSDIDTVTYERVSTGCLGLDIIMGGGMPRASIIQLKGEESVSKTTCALHACASLQKRGENVFWAASEGFSKHWARVNGCFIPYHPREIEKYIERGQVADAKEAKVLNQKYMDQHKGYGQFVLGFHASGPTLLELTSRAVRSNQFGLVVLDSAGAILSEEDDDKDIGDATRVGGNAKILGHFVNKVRLALNSKHTKVDLDKQGNEVKTETFNRTIVIVINQVRAAIGGYSPRGTPPPEAPGGYGLRHGKDIDIRLARGEMVDMASGTGTTRYGRVVKAKCDKNKTAPPHMAASWTFFFKDVPKLGVRAGTMDTADEILAHGVYYGIIKRTGMYYHIGDERLQGKEKAVIYLRENPDMIAPYWEAILEVVAKG